MKLFNRGQRTFNPNTPIAIKPNKWSPELDEAQAAKLLKMYPRELTSNEGEATRHNAQLTEAQEQIKQLEAQNKELRDQVDGLQKLLNDDPLASGLQNQPVKEEEPVETEHHKKSGKKHK